MIQAQVEPGFLLKISPLWSQFTMERRGWVAALFVVGGLFYSLGDHNYRASQAAIKDVSHQIVVAKKEAVVATKVAKTALDACQHNLNAAIKNDASGREIKGCPPPTVVPATK